MREIKLDTHIANWILKLENLNREHKGDLIHGVNSVMVNLLKSIARGQYTPEQLKRDIEAHMNREAFRGWHWIKDIEQRNEMYQLTSANYQLMQKEHEHGFI